MSKAAMEAARIIEQREYHSAAYAEAVATIIDSHFAGLVEAAEKAMREIYNGDSSGRQLIVADILKQELEKVK